MAAPRGPSPSHSHGSLTHGNGESLHGGDNAAHNAITQRKEVDYYLNPTELFRWINYRRWDGAKARVLSHPDECSTWIVSRHNSDGRILWRHLPLHLVCMQSEAGANDGTQQGLASASQTTRLIEELIDVLLEAYPDGASSPDDQGMLPLHLAVANSVQPNERILNLLLMAYPTGVDVKDKYGRTPIDLVSEKAENGPHREAALRVMARAQLTTARFVAALRDENANLVSSVKQSAINERMASQRIIMRLEEELVNARKHLEELEHRARNEEDNSHDLHERLEILEQKLEAAQSTTFSVKRERDDLMSQIEILRNQAEEHEKIVKKLHQGFEDDRQDQADTIANLRSESSTAKAMAEALESQLRSRFTNEEYLTTTVSELETQLADTKNEYQQEKKKLLHERDTYENENTQLKRSVEDLTRKNTAFQTKLTDLNKQLSIVLSSHGALNAEHDRMMEASLRMEADLIENTRNERAQIMVAMRKQWEFFESTIKNQEQLIEDCQKKEVELLDIGKEERDRSVEVISRMRQDFRDARTSAIERQRMMQNEQITGIQPRSSNSVTADRLASNAASHETTHSSGSSYRASNVVGGTESVSSSQQTRRVNISRKPSADLSSVSAGLDKIHNVANDPYATSLPPMNQRTPRPTVPAPIDTRIPPSTQLGMNYGQRQGPSKSEQLDGNLMHLLDARAEHGTGRHSSRVSSNESSTFTSSASTASGLTSSIRRGPDPSTGAVPYKPRMINVAHDGQRLVNFHVDSTSTSSSSPRNGASTTGSSRVSNFQFDSRGRRDRKGVRDVPSLSLDDYSHNSVSTGSDSMDSDSDSSSRGGSNNHHKTGKSRQYSGMAAGLRMGMIRIAEESVSDGSESQYSRRSSRE